jgi:hypothetical protein
MVLDILDRAVHQAHQRVVTEDNSRDTHLLHKLGMECRHLQTADKGTECLHPVRRAVSIRNERESE